VGDDEAGDEEDPVDGIPDEIFGLLGSVAGLVGTEHAIAGAAVVGAAHVLGGLL